MGSKIAETILHDVEDELTDRAGFADIWYSLDEDTRQEIRGLMVGIIDNNIEREASLIKEANTEIDIVANEAKKAENFYDCDN